MNRGSLEEYRKWFQHHRKEILEDYFTLLRFPSISTDPAYKKDVQACAEWLKSYIEKLGLKGRTLANENPSCAFCIFYGSWA